MNRKQWNDEMVESRIRSIVHGTGKMPTNTYLRETGQNDLSCQIVKRGGFMHWASKLGLKREKSDSDTGWDGEKAVCELLTAKGFKCCRSDRVRWPFDILVDSVLRIDVKTACYANYGRSTGWFYRIGKAPQADVIALLKLEVGDVYFIPWYHAPTSNITITISGSTYTRFLNDYALVRRMASTRLDEMKATNL